MDPAIGEKVKKFRYAGHLSQEAWEQMKDLDYETFISIITQRLGRYGQPFTPTPSPTRTNDSQPESGLSSQPIETDYSASEGAPDERPAQSNSELGTENSKLSSQPVQTDYSVKAPIDSQSNQKLTSQSKGKLTSQPWRNAKSEVTDLNAFKAKLTSQSRVNLEGSKWKKSRIKPGYLIQRREGYNIVENEYGVQYLFVVSRKPDRTSADYSVHPFAGFFNWKSLEEAGLLMKEKKDGKRQQTSNE